MIRTKKGRICGVCGTRRRFRRDDKCVRCHEDNRQAAQLHRDKQLLTAAAREDWGSRQSGRKNSDEAAGLAAYYRGPFFPFCEMCRAPSTVDGLVCAKCAPRVAPVPEATFHDPDVSDVIRVLREIGARP